ncbi:MAG TPA: hypothetical protein VGF48_06520 [Thermoanaerobaculia bacterium]|jgi:hypothetical protein
MLRRAALLSIAFVALIAAPLAVALMPAAALTLVVVDAASGQPIAGAEVDQWIRGIDGVMQTGKLKTDGDGMLRLADRREGSATFLVKASGYRLAEVQELLRDGEHAEVRVALQRARALGGRVFGPDGAPLAGAVVMGGYPGDRPTNPVLRARTNENGEFRFPSDANDDTPFYVIAPGHALTVTTLRASDDNVIRLEPLARGIVRVVMKNGAPPTRPRRLRAAPSGGTIIPEHVLAELAKANGLALADIIRTDDHGVSALPRYLGPGAWDVYLRAETSPDVQRLGSIRTPVRGTRVFTANE